MQFKISRSYNDMPCIELRDAPHEQHWFLRRAVSANRFDDPFYQNKQKANPFLQGGSDQKEGWILVEFWGTEEDAQIYVDWLNSVYEQEIQQAHQMDLLVWDLEADQ